MPPASPPPYLVDNATKVASSSEPIDEPNKLQGYASAPGIIDEVTRVTDHKAERRLCRRFDIRLLPILAIMCEYSHPGAWSFQLIMVFALDLFNALDKGNLGNAKTDGMTDGEYSKKYW